MKKITLNLFAAFSLTLLLFSCNQDCDCNKINAAATAAGSDTRTIDLKSSVPKSFREQLVGSMTGQLNNLTTLPRFTFSDEMIPEGAPMQDLTLLTKGSSEGRNEKLANLEATELVTSIFNSLLAAENTANILDIEFSMSDAPVENGSFIFGINSEKEQNLNFLMYDEEGFEMVANNQFSITEGSNYKALNVSSLPNGSYVFKLQNEKEGKELVRRVEVVN